MSYKIEAVEVFANEDGGITIKQDDGYNDPEVVSITLQQVGLLVDILKQAAVDAAEGDRVSGSVPQD